jgi:hypothetical protein
MRMAGYLLLGFVFCLRPQNASTNPNELSCGLRAGRSPFGQRTGPRSGRLVMPTKRGMVPENEDRGMMIDGAEQHRRRMLTR